MGQPESSEQGADTEKGTTTEVLEKKALMAAISFSPQVNVKGPKVQAN